MPELDAGQVLMRTIYISIAPGVRPLLPYAEAEPDAARNASAGRANASDDALPDPTHIRVGERMRSGIVPSTSPFAGGTVGQVVASRHSDFAPGDYIFGGRHWQAFEAVDGDASLKIDPAELPIEADLTLAGRSAFTGWVGYRRIAAAKSGETIVISSAAGAVGMLVVQMAKAAGLRVIGITSGAASSSTASRFITASYRRRARLPIAFRATTQVARFWCRSHAIRAEWGLTARPQSTGGRIYQLHRVAG
jgi:hypothetical protein